MTQKIIARLKIGRKYYSESMCAYRGTDPFKVVGIGFSYIEGENRYVYIVQYDDGEIDCFPVKNEGGLDIHHTVMERHKHG